MPFSEAAKLKKRLTCVKRLANIDCLESSQ
jgi:hypothetical protein